MSKKTYIKTCAQCGVTFEANNHRPQYCSDECRAERDRLRSAAYYADNREQKLQRCREYHSRTPSQQRERQRRYYEANREECLKRTQRNYYKNHADNLDRHREYRRSVSSSAKAEAKRWKPILDEVELKPDNLFLIQALVDELTSDRDLAWLLDWYWLSDATEYLEQQGYEHE